MSEAWVGLIGVVVGAVISTLWAWLAVVRQELSDAMVAARLVDEDLKKLDQGERTGQPSSITDEAWREQRVALAKVLGESQWNAVSDVYRVGMRSRSAEEQATLPRMVAEAHSALRPLVQGKRYVIPQRSRNMRVRSRA